MDAMNQIGLLLTNTIFSVLILLVWLRLLLQIAGADFFNPVSQFVVKSTSPLLHPLRRIIPSVFGLDTAALVLIVILKLVQLSALAHLSGQAVTPSLLFVTSIFSLLLAATDFFFWIILGMVILSWVAMASGGMSPAMMPLMQIAEIVLGPCRRLMPSLGGLDLSPIIAFLAIQIIEILLKSAYPQAIALLAG
ncbi:YggT family protein [Paraperlucidibaca baekdonensis]|uniref:YggT family protein n=1 Tax=Paraperlucidibaca baekdonensis TaxID=748120 RepID=A0A3E0H976_9GAMM|nr:YggT family protein [Paraperlucidibaca baekdonensis]REH40194.1 YggT family protein [Paraperlucidibaca baekdonensis]